MISICCDRKAKRINLFKHTQNPRCFVEASGSPSSQGYTGAVDRKLFRALKTGLLPCYFFVRWVFSPFSLSLSHSLPLSLPFFSRDIRESEVTYIFYSFIKSSPDRVTLLITREQNAWKKPFINVKGAAVYWLQYAHSLARFSSVQMLSYSFANAKWPAHFY